MHIIALEMLPTCPKCFRRIGDHNCWCNATTFESKNMPGYCCFNCNSTKPYSCKCSDAINCQKCGAYHSETRSICQESNVELRAQHTNPTAISCKLCNGYHTVTYECMLSPTKGTTMSSFEFVTPTKTVRVLGRSIGMNEEIKDSDIVNKDMRAVIARGFLYQNGDWIQDYGVAAYNSTTHDNQKITVIKLLRETSNGNLGLKETKEFIESIEELAKKAKLLNSTGEITLRFVTFT